MTEFLAFILVGVYIVCQSGYAFFTKISSNRLILFGGLNLVTFFISIPLMFLVSAPPLESFVFIGASMCAYTIATYFRALSYARTDLSSVVPLSQAFSFICLTLFALFFLNEEGSITELIGIAVVIIGVLIATNVKKLSRIDDPLAVFFIFLGSCATAAQFCFDIIGTRLCENPFSYIVWLMPIGVPVSIVALIKHKKQVLTLLNSNLKPILASSVLDNVGYACILYIIYELRVLFVLPLTALTVVVSVLIGLVILKEKMPFRKLISATLIAGSIIAVQILT